MNTHAGRVALFLLVALTLGRAHADTPSTIDHYVQEQMRRQGIPGLSLAVARDGKPFYLKSYGAATLEHPVRVTPRTVFQIGSIGKQFTAVALMLLANEHKLSFDDPVRKYLPSFPPNWDRVTLRLMLNHQAGIAQFTTPRRQLLDLSHDYTDDELIRLAAGQPLDFEPGTDVSYSDTGYVLLGFVINRVAGMFYGDLLQRRVFGPLGMTRTRIISDSDIIADRASGCEKTDTGALRNQTPVSPALNRTADGSLYSTVVDLLKWDAALDGDAVLPHAQLERMWQVDSHSNGRRPLYHYGYGWEDNRIGAHRVIEYDGNWQGFQAAMARYADAHLTVIVLTNLSLCRTERLVHSVAGLVDPTLAPYPEAIRDAAPERTAQFNRFLIKVADSDAAADGDAALPLSESARATWVPQPLKTLRRDLQELGPLLRFSLAAESADHRTYRAEGRDMVEYYTVQYDGAGRIKDLDLLREF